MFKRMLVPIDGSHASASVRLSSASVRAERRWEAIA